MTNEGSMSQGCTGEVAVMVSTIGLHLSGCHTMNEAIVRGETATNFALFTCATLRSIDKTILHLSFSMAYNIYLDF